MKYTVIIKRTAQKQILRLPKIYLEKVKKAILSLEIAPRPHGCIKLTGSENIYRIRVGPYRIVYSIEDAELIVFIFDVDDRKDVYK
ncbi:MAG: type II toxin-antitoxin system RelE/ParE family toxin [Chitinophagales bacterium]